MFKRPLSTVSILLCAIPLALLTSCSSQQKNSLRPSHQTTATSTVVAAYVEPDAVLSECLGWGAGTSGFALHSASSAASLLEWAEENSISGTNRSRAEDSLRRWYTTLSEAQQQNFAENWQSIAEDAQIILTDRSNILELLNDAGVDTDSLPAYTQSNWNILSTVLNSIVPLVEDEMQ